jgi:hypothetical protein
VLVDNERLSVPQPMLCLAFIRGRPRIAPDAPCVSQTSPIELLHERLTPAVDAEAGMVTSAAAQVRLQLWSGTTLTVATIDGRPDFTEDFFVAFHPRSDPVRRMPCSTPEAESSRTLGRPRRSTRQTSSPPTGAGWSRRRPRAPVPCACSPTTAAGTSARSHRRFRATT